MNKTPCFSPAHILLPSEQIPVGQWGCVACDQFTSDRSYWEKAAQAEAQEAALAGEIEAKSGELNRIAEGDDAFLTRQHTGPDPAGGLSGRG